MNLIENSGRTKHEILYFLSTIIVGLVIFHFNFGLTNIDTESVLDVNVHDTYFIIKKIELLPLICLSISYLLYLLKIGLQKFKNLQSLLVFCLLNLILIVIFPFLLSFVKSLSVEAGWIVYPPLSAPKVEIKETIFNTMYDLLYYVFIFIIIVGILAFLKLVTLHKNKQ